MSRFLVFESIEVLMIASRTRKWNDDQFWIFIECCQFCKCSGTPTSDRDISILYEFCNIILIDPIEYLTIWYIGEFWSKIFIEFSESNDPFITIISTYLFYDGLEYGTRSLAPTYDEYVWFLSFPLYWSSREIFRLIKYWV